MYSSFALLIWAISSRNLLTRSLTGSSIASTSKFERAFVFPRLRLKFDSELPGGYLLNKYQTRHAMATIATRIMVFVSSSMGFLILRSNALSASSYEQARSNPAQHGLSSRQVLAE